MIRAALPYLGDMPVIYMTDFLFRTTSPWKNSASSSCHPMIYPSFLSLWQSVSSRVVKQHVRGHTGNPINTLADSAAKAAWVSGIFARFYRHRFFQQSVPSSRQTADSDFHKWL